LAKVELQDEAQGRLEAEAELISRISYEKGFSLIWNFGKGRGGRLSFAYFGSSRF